MGHPQERIVSNFKIFNRAPNFISYLDRLVHCTLDTNRQVILLSSLRFKQFGTSNMKEICNHQITNGSDNAYGLLSARGRLNNILQFMQIFKHHSNTMRIFL